MTSTSHFQSTEESSIKTESPTIEDQKLKDMVTSREDQYDDLSELESESSDVVSGLLAEVEQESLQQSTLELIPDRYEQSKPSARPLKAIPDWMDPDSTSLLGVVEKARQSMMNLPDDDDETPQLLDIISSFMDTVCST